MHNSLLTFVNIIYINGEAKELKNFKITHIASYNNFSQWRILVFFT